MSTYKNYLGQLLDSYTDTYQKLYNKYTTLHKNIELSHKENKDKIEDNYYKAKNDLSVSSAIANQNVKKSLLDKGLSRSGDSVQAEISGNLSKNAGLAQLDAERNNSLAQNETDRALAHGKLYTEYMDEGTSLDKELLANYIKQMNADREYALELSRDEEKKRQWQAEFDADRTDSEYEKQYKTLQYKLDEDKAKSDKAQQDFENNLALDELELDKAKAYANIAATDRELKIEEERAEIENAKSSLDIYDRYFTVKDSASADNSNNNDGSSVSERLVPSISATKLVDNIVDHYYYNAYSDNSQETIKEKIAHIIANRNIDYDYRYEVKLYAKSLGLYDGKYNE